MTGELEVSTHLAGDPTLLNLLLFRAPELAVHILAHILLTHVLKTYIKSFFSCTNVKLRKRAHMKDRHRHVLPESFLKPSGNKY